MTSQASEIERRLEKFIQDFVTHFETYFSEYYERLRQGVGKAGKSADLLRDILEIGKSGTEIAEGVTKATSLTSICLLQSIVNAVGMRINRKDVKKLNDKLYEFKKDPLKVRQILVDGAATVFVKYEPLFLRLTTTDQSKSWQRGLEKVAQDAVNRTIDYLRINPQDDFSVALITKGVISGKSKRYKSPSGVINLHTGHKNLEISGLATETTVDLFEKVGLIKGNDFYVKKLADGYGFRALFDWETTVSGQSFVITDQPPSFDYSFTLEEKFSEIAANVFRILDPAQNVDSKVFEQTVEDARKMADKLLFEIDKNYEEIKNTFMDIKKELNEINKGMHIMGKQLGRLEKIGEKNLENNNDLSTLTKESIKVGKETHTLLKDYISLRDQPELLNQQKEETVWFDVTEPTGLFTGRSKEIKMLSHYLQHVDIRGVAICGLGGIGKSELAKKYIEIFGKSNFDNVLWINSENEISIIQSFFRLAKDKLQLSTLDANGKEKAPKSVIDDVIGHFKRRKNKTRTLFVLDNADKSVTTILNQFYAMEQSEQRARILITTSEQQWGRGVESLSVKELLSEEAIELVRKGLRTAEPNDRQEIKELVEVLQCFPLALQQAIAYIENQSMTGYFTIGDYLKKFQKKADELLDLQINEVGNCYAKTTVTVWKMTMDRIKSDEKYRISAYEILGIMAFLAPENIRRDWFSELIKDDEELLKSTVQLLVKYSMINSSERQSILSIHRLVQQITRRELKISGQTMDVFDETYKLLKRNSPLGLQTMCSMKERRQLLPHYESFNEYLEKWIENFPEDEKVIELKYMKDLLHSMYDAYSLLGNFKRSSEVLERLLIILEKHPKTEELGAVLLHLGTCYIFLGNPRRAKEFLEQALEILKKYDDQKLLLAVALTNLGNCYGALGNYSEEIKLHKEALAIQKPLLDSCQNLKHDNQQMFLVSVNTLVNLGNYYGKLFDYDQQMYLQETALKCYEAILEPNHFSIGTTLMYLSYAYGNQQRYVEQLEALHKAKDIYIGHYGEDHLEVAKLYVNMGNAYNGLKDPLRAREYSEKAYKIQEKFHNEGNFEIIPTLIQLGESCGQLQDHQGKIEFLQSALAMGEEFYEGDALALSEIKKKLSKAYCNLEQPKKQLELLTEVLHIEEKYQGTHPFETVSTWCQIAQVNRILGNSLKEKEALKNAEDVITRFSSDTKENLLISPLTTLAFAYNDLQKRKELLEKVLKISENCYGSDHINTAKALYHVASVSRSEWSKQIKLLERTIAIQQEHYKNDNIEMTDSFTSLAGAYASMGNLKKAVELFERALKAIEDFWGSDHIKTVDSLVILASFYILSEENEKAVEHLNRALNIERKFYSDCEYKLVPLLIQLSEASNQSDYLEEALRLTEQHFQDPEHVECAKILTVLAKTYADLEKRVEVQENVSRIMNKRLGLEHLQTTEAMVSLIESHINSGKMERAREMLQEVTEALKKLYPKANITTTVQLRTLAEIYGRLKDYQQMKELLEMSLKIEESCYDRNHPALMATLRDLSDAYKALDLLEEERETLERQMNIINSHYATDQTRPLTRLSRLIVIYEKCNQLDKKDKAIERLMQSTQIIFGSSVNTDYILANIELLGTVEGWNVFRKKFHTDKLRQKAFIGDFADVTMLLCSGGDLLARDDHDTLLHFAVGGGHTEVIKLILYFIRLKHPDNCGDYLNAKDTEGDTPLMWAAEKGKTHIAEILLQHGCDINERNSSGETALHWATKGGFESTVQLLLKYNADLSIKNNDGQTALEVAKGNFEKHPDDEVFKTIYALILSFHNV